MNTKNNTMTRTGNENRGAGPKSEGSGDNADLQQMFDEVCESVRSYSAKHPGMMTGLVFFAGFYLGWKIEPW